METSGDAHEAQRSRQRSFLSRLNRLVEARWPIAAYRIVNAFALVAFGVLIEHAQPATIAIVFAAYVIPTVIVEYGLAETKEDIENRINKNAEERGRRLATEVETYAAAETFLTERLRRNTGAVSILRSGDSSMIANAKGSIARIPAINETLKYLCNSLSAICSKTQNITRPDAWFRATYMEVQGPPDNQSLVYMGWHTLDDSPPRSMTLNVSYRKGEGCAGLAWERSRPVIEDDFKDRHEWKENYTQQSTNYKSMICVPVLKGYGTNTGDVIGVITVDTQVDHYFGKKDDRTEEDRISRMIRPYGTYIAFISAVDNAFSDLISRLPVDPPNVPHTPTPALPNSAPRSDAPTPLTTRGRHRSSPE